MGIDPNWYRGARGPWVSRHCLRVLTNSSLFFVLEQIGLVLAIVAFVAAIIIILLFVAWIFRTNSIEKKYSSKA